jgi:imidazolonepropionase-like amidohydrolase
VSKRAKVRSLALSALLALIAMLLGTLGPGAGAQSGASQVKVLVGGRLIDGFGGRPIEDSVVVIEGDRIVAVGRQGEVAIPEGAEVISTEGMSVLPGLWDAQERNQSS